MNSIQNKQDSIHQAQTDPIFFSDEYESSNTCLLYRNDTNNREQSIESYQSEPEVENKSISHEKNELIKSFLEAFEPYYIKKDITSTESVDSITLGSGNSAITVQPKNDGFSSINSTDFESVNANEDSEFYRESLWTNKSFDDINSCKFKSYGPDLNILGRIREAYNNCTCKTCECISDNIPETNGNPICDCYSCQNKEHMFSNTYFENLANICNNVSENEHMYPNGEFLSNTICKCSTCECETCVMKENNTYIESFKKKTVKSSTIIVAAVEENIHESLCDCSPCACYECVGHSNEVTAHPTTNASTAMSTTNHGRCSCAICDSERCYRSADACTCTEFNLVTSKPVEKEKDFDIHRMSLYFVNPLVSTLKKHNHTIAMVSAVSNDVDLENGSERTTCKRHSNTQNIIKKFNDQSNFIPLAKVIGRSESMNETCTCSPCDCQVCKKNQNVFEDEKCEICLKQKRKKSKVKWSSTKITNASEILKVDYISENGCKCNLCDCVYCQKINKNIPNVENKSNESVYPIKRGRLLTPSVLKTCFQADNEKTIKERLIFSSLEASNDENNYDSSMQRPHIIQETEVLISPKALIVPKTKTVLTKCVSTYIDFHLNYNNVCDDAVKKIENVKKLSEVKINMSEFKCLHSCCICNNQTIMTINDVEISHSKKETVARKMVQFSFQEDKAIHCDLYKNNDVTGFVSVLKRSRMLTLRYNEVIKQYETSKNRQSGLSANVFEDESFITSKENSEIVDSCEVDSFAETVKSSDEMNIDDQSTIVTIPKTALEIAKNDIDLPKGLYNEENYNKYKDMIKSVVNIINNVKKMKNVINIDQFKKELDKPIQKVKGIHTQVHNVAPADEIQEDLSIEVGVGRNRNDADCNNSTLERLENEVENIFNLAPDASSNMSNKQRYDEKLLNNLKVEILGVRKVSEHTLMVKWNLPKDLTNVIGYEMLIDGRSVKKTKNKLKSMAFFACSPETEVLLLTIKTLVKSAIFFNQYPATTLVFRKD